jgi:dATP pyrophosphohydrolase
VHTIPDFAAEIDKSADIKLDAEHTEFKWIGIEEVENFIPWPEQRRLMQLTCDILTDKMYQILPEWIIEY